MKPVIVQIITYIVKVMEVTSFTIYKRDIIIGQKLCILFWKKSEE